MKITLTANLVEEPGKNGFTSWLEEIPSVVAHGESLEDAKSELIRILGIKLKVDGERQKSISKNELGLISEEMTFSSF